jgi:hypothetical protein
MIVQLNFILEGPSGLGLSHWPHSTRVRPRAGHAGRLPKLGVAGVGGYTGG